MFFFNRGNRITSKGASEISLRIRNCAIMTKLELNF